MPTQLTRRQGQVLKLIGLDYTRPQMCRALKISLGGLKHRLAAVFKKSGVHSMREVASALHRNPTGRLARIADAAFERKLPGK